MEKQPLFILFAGVNGAGKSTLYSLFESDFKDTDLLKMKRVNPDEILRHFGGDYNNPADQNKSAKLAVQNIRQFVHDKVSFNQETTLSGNTYSLLKNLNRLKSLGYGLHLYYIGLNSVSLSKERVALRVAKGGHGIAETLLDKRYARSLSNLAAVIELFDEVSIFDNSGEGLQRVLKIKDGQILIDKLADFPYLSVVRHITRKI